ncbi:alpha/beta fold hydrolase [Aestuariibacter halophilus]|uniref:Alpha/beta fold hydrolase n=1 Tax=Fluctibacter halophilus TaxID=226011 RepID=A0ABS8G8Y1_9ALTE|nr:alpha/beta hydrolase [Aestuariibacter halophilus]MCC2616164.1 alpha/beta fold hydrolase [Aestuariibacter halophilus]
MQTSPIVPPHCAASPVVAIHGSASNGGIWAPLSQLAGGKRRVVAPTLQGYGEQDTQRIDYESTLSQRAVPVLETIDSLAGQVHLLAHSFGASVALEILRVIPERINSVTLFEPVTPVLLKDKGEAHDLELLADLLALAALVKETHAEVGMETFVNFWHGADVWQQLPQRVRVSLARYAPVVYQDFIEAYYNQPEGLLSTVRYTGPFSLLVGQHTNAHARRMTEVVALQFAQARVNVIDGVGHMGPVTHPIDVQSRMFAQIEQMAREHGNPVRHIKAVVQGGHINHDLRRSS